MNKLLFAIFLFLIPLSASAAIYKFDTEGMHASINFKVKHIGYSWLTGRFDKFEGQFNFDQDTPENSTVSVDIDVTSVNTNHALRDKHIVGEKYLNVGNFPKAHFQSTSIEITGDNTGTIHGNLTLNGVTKPIVLMASHVGGGDDPWGGFRQGFTATTTLNPKDFNYQFDFGNILLELQVEGVEQK